MRLSIPVHDRLQVRRFRAHDSGPCINAEWHPLEPSWVATCGWDGMIKLWD